MSEKLEIGDLVDIEASEGFVGGVFEVAYTFYDTVYIDCGDGDVRAFSAKSLRKVTPEADPRKINIVSARIWHVPFPQKTTLVIRFTMGSGTIVHMCLTHAVCSPLDTFKERTGRKIAMKRACAILGVSMREIAEAM